jgi:hypothetical protein
VTKENNFKLHTQCRVGLLAFNYQKEVGFLVLKEMIMKRSLLGCNYVQSGKSPTLQRNKLPPPSRSKKKPTNKPAETSFKLSELHAENPA